MAKKRTIDIKATPVAVESGDVNISYNNVLIGSLSESGSATLETENTICEHDIEIEYTKPGVTPSTITIPVYIDIVGEVTKLTDITGTPGEAATITYSANFDEIRLAKDGVVSEVDNDSQLPYSISDSTITLPLFDPTNFTVAISHDLQTANSYTIYTVK